MNVNCRLAALHAYTPETVITNEDLARLTDTSDAWIVSRTGIRERRKLADDQNASDMGLIVAGRVLERAGLEARALTHIIAATCTQDNLSPSVACVIGGKLNAGPLMAFDFSAACSGFIYGLSLARGILADNNRASVLFVCTEALTRRLNWADRSTCVLFGDGAAACLCSGDVRDGDAVVEDVLCRSDGALKDLITIGGGSARGYGLGEAIGPEFFLRMNGRETYRHAVRRMTDICEEILARNGLGIGDVDLLVPHQANIRIIEAVGSRLGISAEHVFTNVAHYGNTSSASIPMALAQAVKQGRVRPGDRVLVTAFGAGLTWGGALLHF